MRPRIAEPIRTCVGCRRRLPASSLVRCAVVDGQVRLGRTLPGRGAWLCPTPECVAAAVRRGGLARALGLSRHQVDDSTREQLTTGCAPPGSSTSAV